MKNLVKRYANDALRGIGSDSVLILDEKRLTENIFNSIKDNLSKIGFNHVFPRLSSLFIELYDNMKLEDVLGHKIHTNKNTIYIPMVSNEDTALLITLYSTRFHNEELIKDFHYVIDIRVV